MTLSSNDAPSFADLPENLTLNLLEDCIVNNPVAALNNHYMKKGVQEDFKSYFREEAFQMARTTKYLPLVYIHLPNQWHCLHLYFTEMYT